MDLYEQSALGQWVGMSQLFGGYGTGIYNSPPPQPIQKQEPDLLILLCEEDV